MMIFGSSSFHCQDFTLKYWSLLKSLFILYAFTLWASLFISLFPFFLLLIVYLSLCCPIEAFGLLSKIISIFGDIIYLPTLSISLIQQIKFLSIVISLISRAFLSEFALSISNACWKDQQTQIISFLTLFQRS
jgi:hypothetical protein